MPQLAVCQAIPGGCTVSSRLGQPEVRKPEGQTGEKSGKILPVRAQRWFNMVAL
jgi:hypothetical protein